MFSNIVLKGHCHGDFAHGFQVSFVLKALSTSTFTRTQNAPVELR